MRRCSPLLLAGWLVSLVLLSAEGSLSAEGGRPRKCILVFGAHADDVEGLAGGTFAKYIAAGYEGCYVCVTNNSAGCVLENTQSPRWGLGTRFTVSTSPKMYPVDALETIQIRQEEARQAAAIFGAIPVFLDFREIFIWQGRKECFLESEEFHQYQPPGRPVVSTATVLDEQVGAVVDLLKKFQPEIVIIHALGGDKLEHGNSAYLMYKAFVRAMQQGVPVGKMWMKVNGWLLDAQAKNSGRGKPDVRIDIKDFLKIKYEAFSRHVSQKSIFYRDYVERNQVKPGDLVEEFITVLDNTSE